MSTSEPWCTNIQETGFGSRFRGSAWIERPDSSGFLSYPEQLSGESFLTYLRPAWDGKIWTTPGVGPAVPASPAWRHS
jgi:hypothetical protein